jgi:hypothetical protein
MQPVGRVTHAAFEYGDENPKLLQLEALSAF